MSKESELAYETSFKSIAYSKKRDGKNWCIYSIGVASKPKLCTINAPLNLYLCRKIIYLSENSDIEQIGRFYIPLFSLRYLRLFLKILWSQKSLGHYLVRTFDSNVSISLIARIEKPSMLNIFFTGDVILSCRLITVDIFNLCIYVEEELAV